MARKNDRRRGVDARGDGANLHLASVIGPGSRKPAGWQVADHMRIPRITLRRGCLTLRSSSAAAKARSRS